MQPAERGGESAAQVNVEGAETLKAIAHYADMPRYFFHVFNDEVSMDEEGSLLPDLDSARETAMDGCRDLVCESVKKGHLNLDHRIDVANERGEVLLHVTFREAFTIQG